jgi:hypothetical protein
MTTCIAQVVELHAALEKIKEDSGRWNKRLAKLRMKQEAACATAAPPKLPQARQRPAGSDPARTARRSKDRVRPKRSTSAIQEQTFAAAEVQAAK